MVNVSTEKILAKLPEILEFQQKNGRLPNFITVDGQKVMKKDYLDALKRFANFTVEEDRLPYSINMQVQIAQKKAVSGVYVSPRFRHYMDQETNYWCGPFMDSQIIYELYGMNAAQKYLAEHAGTTTSGTGSSGVIKAITDWANANGHKVTCNLQNFSDTGWKKCGEMVEDPDLGLGFHVKYKNTWGHWMYPVSIDLNKKVVGLIDSLNPADLIYVSFAEYEQWIKNTAGGQPSCFVVKKAK